MLSQTGQQQAASTPLPAVLLVPALQANPAAPEWPLLWSTKSAHQVQFGCLAAPGIRQGGFIATMCHVLLPNDFAHWMLTGLHRCVLLGWVCGTS